MLRSEFLVHLCLCLHRGWPGLAFQPFPGLWQPLSLGCGVDVAAPLLDVLHRMDW